MATSMSSNKLVWVLVAVLVIGVSIALINSFNNTEQEVKKPAKAAPVSKQQADKFFVVDDADTVEETLRKVQAGYNSQVNENDKLKTDIEAMKKEMKDLKDGQGKAGQVARLNLDQDPTMKNMLDNLAGMKEDFKVLQDNVTTGKKNDIASGNGYEVSQEDLGWGDTTSKKAKELAQSAGPKVMPGYVAIRPMTRSQLLSFDPKLAEQSLKNKLGSGLNSQEASTVKNTLKNSSKKVAPEITPHYTIPARSTIFSAVGMTALIGTVPVGGKLTDPFPAKFIVGEENLATNGLRIPGLKGIVFEGIARGNWNLSCVAVSLTSATYTFADGRVQHMGYDQELGGGGGSKAGKSRSPYAEGEASQSIGYVSNPQGIPCIPGKRITDAHKQLFTMGLLGAAASHFDAKAAAETTTTDNPLGGGSTSVTGDKASFVNNQTYANSIATAMDFYEKRNRDSFDAIWADSAANVSLNITQDLYIDYHSDARKLAYSNTGESKHGLD